MLNIKKKYVVDEAGNKLSVEVDIRTFAKIEEILENYGLYKLMQETEKEESLNIAEAKKYYSELK